MACNEHTRGNFGQLDSPRKNSNQKQTVYAENVAFGLDHHSLQFATRSRTATSARATGNPVGAKIDDDTAATATTASTSTPATTRKA